MKILIASPILPTAIGGPATVARELSRIWRKQGEQVQIITFNSFERRMPHLFRQGMLFLRLLIIIPKVDAVLILDPASTGPSAAVAAKLCRRRSVARIGGDFLWESWVERTKQAVLLSEFYTEKRSRTFREHLIYWATKKTLHTVDCVAFTTAWQRELWRKPYDLSASVEIIENPVSPRKEVPPATQKVFIAIGRPMHIKNREVLLRAWEIVIKKHPEAVLDTTPKSAVDYQTAIQNCYAVVVPSLSEVSSQSVFEAIEFGKPFIATRDTGSYATHKDAGIFIDTRKPELLAEAILMLLDPEAYKTAKSHVLAYSYTRSWEQVATEFRKLLS